MMGRAYCVDAPLLEATLRNGESYTPYPERVCSMTLTAISPSAHIFCEVCQIR